MPPRPAADDALRAVRCVQDMVGVMERWNGERAGRGEAPVGIGIGLIPDYLTDEEADLVPVLRDVELPNMQIYFCYPEELKTAKKVQVFRDFLVSKARQWQL